MRIVIVNPTLVVRGGAENVLVWLATALAGRGHEVKVVTSRVDHARFPTGSWPFEVAEIGGEGGRPTVAGMRALGRRLAPHLVGADVVNPHQYPSNFWTHWADPPAQATVAWLCHEPVKRLYTPPLQPHFRSLMASRNRESRSLPVTLLRSWTLLRRPSQLLQARADRSTRRLDSAVAEGFEAVMVNSEFVRQQLEAILGLATFILPLGVPAPAAEPAPAGPGVRLLSVARLWPEKNIETILKALAIVRDLGVPDVSLRVVGSGPDAGYLRALRDELGLAALVSFEGGVDDATLEEYHRQSSAFILLPLDESFGLVFAEAGLRGRPSIASDHGGPAEVVEHGETGLLVNALDPVAVAGAIVELAVDPARASRMGLAARMRIQARHSVEGMTDRFLDIVVANSGRARRTP